MNILEAGAKYFADIAAKDKQLKDLIKRMRMYPPIGKCWCPKGKLDTDWYTHSAECSTILDGLRDIDEGRL